jgi:hypothetical protein
MKDEVDNHDGWILINEFLRKERDSIFATLNHVRLAFAAGIIAAILLSGSSLIRPFSAYLEFHEDRSRNLFTIVFLISFAVTVLLILMFVIAALGKLYRAFKQSMMDDLHNRVTAVKAACEEANVKIPLKTQKLLETFDYEDIESESEPDQSEHSSK